MGLTTMLVMTTIFISVMERLPFTSYPKMIDYWLIFCQLVPFVEVILLTAMEYLREEIVEKDEETETNKSRTFVTEESSDKTETPSQDVEVIEPIEGWPEQERK